MNDAKVAAGKTNLNPAAKSPFTMSCFHRLSRANGDGISEITQEVIGGHGTVTEAITRSDEANT